MGILASRGVFPSKPFALTQFLLSNQAINPLGQPGDPAMIALPAAAQFETNYIFLVPQGYTVNYVTAIRQAGTDVTLDGVSVAAGLWRPLGSLSGVASSTDADDDATGESGDAPQGGGVIEVTLSGGDVDLGGTVVVSYNGSLGVASVYDNGATLTGSFQFDELSVGTFELSSQQRVDTGLVVNLTDVSSTWTNLDADALVTGRDTISGTLTVETWSPARGVATLQLDAVTLRNVVDGGLCTVDGTIETTQLYP